MSLLGNLFKKVLGGVKKANSQSEERSYKETQSSRQSYSAPSGPIEEEEKKLVPLKSRSEWMAHFSDILKRRFKDFEIDEDVPARAFDKSCHPACTPVQFVLLKAGRPVLCVVLVRVNTYRGMNVKGTKSIIERRGLPYVRFFEEMENKEEYVVERINKFLA